jgi:hypothetical protein
MIVEQRRPAWFQSRNGFQHGFLDTIDVWARQGSEIGSLGKGSFDFTTYNMLPVPLSSLDSTHVGGNHATETVRNWERTMIAYKKELALFKKATT